MGRTGCTAHRHSTLAPFQGGRDADEASPWRCEKGAFDEAEAQKRFDAWKAAHDKEVANFNAKKAAKAAEEAKARLDAEVEKNRLKGEAVAKKRAEKLAAEEAAAKAAHEAENAAEAPADAPAE